MTLSLSLQVVCGHFGHQCHFRTQIGGIVRTQRRWLTVLSQFEHSSVRRLLATLKHR